MKILSGHLSGNRKLFYLFAYFIATFILVTIIHETGHFVAALALGVPFNQIKIIFISGNPGLLLPESFNNSPVVYQYAGGFSAAAVLLIIYFLIWFRRYRKESTWYIWGFGCITFLCFGEEVGNGIVEGHFHAAYIYYINYMFSPTNILIIIFAIVGVILHFAFFQLPRVKTKNA